MLRTNIRPHNPTMSNTPIRRNLFRDNHPNIRISFQKINPSPMCWFSIFIFHCVKIIFSCNIVWWVSNDTIYTSIRNTFHSFQTILIEYHIYHKLIVKGFYFVWHIIILQSLNHAYHIFSLYILTLNYIKRTSIFIWWNESLFDLVVCNRERVLYLCWLATKEHIPFISYFPL